MMHQLGQQVSMRLTTFIKFLAVDWARYTVWLRTQLRSATVVLLLALTKLSKV